MFEDFYNPFGEVLPEGKDKTPIKLLDYDNVGSTDKKGKVFDYGGFKPWDFQHVIIKALDVLKMRRAFLILPRRAGKTHLMVVYIVRKALQKAMNTDLPNLRYGIAYQELSSGKTIAWDHLFNVTENLPNRHINTQTATVSFTITNAKGRRVKVTLSIIGLKNIHAKRGLSFDGLVIDERGFIMPGWEPIIAPTLADKTHQPTWLIMIGTPSEGCGFWEDYDKIEKSYLDGREGFFAFHGNYDSLQHINVDEYTDLCEQLSQDQINTELHCIRGGVSGGTYFPDELNKAYQDGRVCSIVDDKNQGKVLVADIGSSKSDKFAIWVWQLNSISGKIQAINHTEIGNASPEKVAKWVQDNSYRVHTFVLPWDGETGFGINTKDQIQELFPQANIVVLPRGKKLHGINAARSFMNKVEFDEVNCTEGLNALRNHSKVFDMERGVFIMDSRHDKWSHSVDSFRYSAEAYLDGKLIFDKRYGNYMGGDSDVKVPPYDPMNVLQGIV